MRFTCGLLLVSLLVCSTLAFNLVFDGPELETSSENFVTIADGTIEGAVYETARAFYAIPYAAPPTGDLRWVEPQPAIPWNTTLK